MRPLIVAAAIAVLAAGAFLLGRASYGPSAPGRVGEEAGEALARVEAVLGEERAARERLETEVAHLAAELELLRLPAADVGSGEVAPGGVDVAGAGAAGEGDPPGDAAGGVSTEKWFDEAALVLAGLRPSDAAALRELYEEIEMERLYLRDTAIRERWTGQKLQAEQIALDARLRGVGEEWGEDVYDWFLYAAGRTNRVVVESVLGGSPASEAGVQAGDEVISYAGRRVFTPKELRIGTNVGSLGETVVLEISRGGQIRSISLPRGPLGVRLDTIAAPPRRL
jgi:hypothetical protein